MESPEERVNSALGLLASWLPEPAANRSRHPIVEWIEHDRRAGILDDFTARGVESIAAYAGELDRRSPAIHGLESLRGRMRSATSDSDLWDVRLEMGIGAALAGRGLEFRLGGPPDPEPDFVLTDLGIGIEVTRRQYDGPSVVEQTIETAARLAGIAVRMCYSTYPLQIRQDSQDAITSRIDEALAAGSLDSLEFEIPTFTGPVKLVVHFEKLNAVNREPIVTVEVADALLSATMEQAEQAVATKARDPQKIQQALAMPTILLVEVSDIGRAWLRGMQQWVRVLESLLPEGSPFLGLGVLQRDIRTTTLDAAIALNSRSDPAHIAAGEDLFRRLGLAR